MTEGGSGLYRLGITTASPDSMATRPVERSVADRRMRRLLGLPVSGPKASIMGAHNAFSGSIALSAVRCLITYVAIPLLGPVVGLTGAVGPALGLVLGVVSIAFIVFSIRRFFAADHKWRWWYGSIGGGLLVLLAVQAAIDIRNLIA